MVVIGLSQLMVTLDNSIVNIALPTAQADLGFRDAQRPWIVTAYALAFGSLLLPGGRVGDRIGRKRAFLIGLVGFAGASVVGGVAPDFATLVAARVLQGVFGALLAPSALSLLTTMYPDGRARARAFGVFAAVGVSGSSAGMLLGGLLTQYVGWRWCMYVNVAFAAAALAGGLIVLPSPRTLEPRRLDVPGAVTAAGGSFLLVYALSTAETHGWTAMTVLGPLFAGALLLVAFVLVQRRTSFPLLPLRLVLDRTRGGALLSCFIAVIGLFGVTLFLTYVMQRGLGFSPVRTGLGFLPMVLGIMATAVSVPTLLLTRFGPRPVAALGLIASAGALFWLSRLTSSSGYTHDVFGPLLLMGLGLGTTISSALNTATAGADPQDAGMASAAVNSVQQIGGSVGLALLAGIAGSGSDGGSSDALPGYARAFLVAAVLFSLTALATVLLIPGRTRAGDRPR